ncbi:MAG: DUF2786 domain-containing protein [Deltaproteobacteria bacterium]|nr:DUF2786 domain-containing protein [Deltaproteobacteria bacterium]
MRKLNLSGTVPKVTIDVYDSEVTWGFWKPETRVIGINSKLILGYPWDASLGILRHETAHQLVSDLYPKAAESDNPHGKYFNLICDRLKLHPVYRGAKADLNASGLPPCNIGPQKDRSDDNPLFLKIKKLLALSGSPEPHEAEAALTKASELMAKHNIDSASVLAEAEDFEIWRLPLKSKRVDRKFSMIASILQGHFFVRAVICTRYDPSVCEDHKCIDLIGRPANLSMANHVYHYLDERAESLWEKHKPMAAHRGEKGIGAKTAFITGLLHSLDTKLTKAERERAPIASPNAPAQGGPAKPLLPAEFILADEKLDGFMATNYPTLTRSSGYRVSDASPYSASAGRAAGEKLNVYRPIAKARGVVKGYLDGD